MKGQTTRWAAPGLSVDGMMMARWQALNFKQVADRCQH